MLEYDSGTLLPKGADTNIVQNINVPDTVSAPIKKGDKLGEVVYTLNDETISTIDVIANEDVDKIDFFNMTKHIFNRWLNMY